MHIHISMIKKNNDEGNVINEERLLLTAFQDRQKIGKNTSFALHAIQKPLHQLTD